MIRDLLLTKESAPAHKAGCRAVVHDVHSTCGDGLLVAPCVVRGRGSQRPGEQPRPAVRAPVDTT